MRFVCVVTTSEPATEVPKPPPPWGHVVSHCGVSHSPLTPTSRPLLAATPNMVLGIATHHLMATSYPPPRMEKNKEESAVVRKTPSTYYIHIGTYICCPHISAHGASCSPSYRLILQLYPRHTPIRSRTHISNLLIITASVHIPYQYVLITYLFRHFSPTFGRQEEGNRTEPRDGDTAPRSHGEHHHPQAGRADTNT